MASPAPSPGPGAAPAPAGATLAIVKLAESTQAPTAADTVSTFSARRLLGTTELGDAGGAPALTPAPGLRALLQAAPAAAPSAAGPSPAPQSVYILFRFDFSEPGARQALLVAEGSACRTALCKSSTSRSLTAWSSAWREHQAFAWNRALRDQAFA